MSEELNNTQTTEGSEATVEPGTTGLPSDQDGLEDSLTKFTVDEEFVKKNFKNGKLYGRFDSIEAVLNTLHAVETKHSNIMRDLKSGKLPEGIEITGGDQTQAPETPVYEVAAPVINKFMENGFSYDGLEADIEALSAETGKSVAEIKLAGIELKDRVQNAWSTVGGKENYDNMIGWAKENLNASEKKAFDSALQSGLDGLVIEGLWSRFQKAGGKGDDTPSRIEGDSAAPVGVRPYATTQELLRDRAYLNSPAGRADRAAQELHQRRLRLTPDKVIYGR